ncbi:phenylalanine--tRNA ligase subunit beta [Patescibacteria group bacterium]|nr:phenylalanine--tRNA ligase subunit beta [Patescibacteria group bacterium]MCL5797462.1 phenylalanine--tRNA ligase subunit beta [Patescibacteria group bacterium]
MNILVPDSWLREYLETTATPEEIKEYLSLCGPSVERINKDGKDWVYEIEITTNRIDMAGVYGIAREAAAILPRFGIKARLKDLDVQDKLPYTANPLPMDIKDPAKICNRIMGIVLKVDQMKTSPEFMQKRIEKSGVRSLNNLVDITNYVMLEVGHPCHVFDYDRVKTHTFILRKAKKDEPIITLDEKKFLLSDEDVVIDDGTGRVIDLPGIMGTQNSVVTPDTQRIIFFIESNNPILIRKTSMRYGIRTMAASINEKHPDPQLVNTAILRGIELYKKYAGGEILGNLIDIYPNKTKPSTILVTCKFINDRLGVELKSEEIIDILRSLRFNVSISSSDNPQPRIHPASAESHKRRDNPQLIITPPSFRQFDIAIPEDIVEEVARLYGYHSLPTRLMEGSIPISDKPKDIPLEKIAKQALKYWGFTEVYNYSFVSKELIIRSGLDPKKHLKVANPLTEEIEYMRQSLIPSIAQNIAFNQNLESKLRLFEMANIYIPRDSGLPDEINILTVASQSTFSDMKGIAEALLKELGIVNYDFSPSYTPLFHRKQTVSIKVGRDILGTVGKIDPQLMQNFSIKNDIFVCQVDMQKVTKLSNPSKKYTPIPLYPPVREDLTLVNTGKPIGNILKTVKEANHLVASVELIDTFKNNISLRVTYQDRQKNLESEEVKKVRERILNRLSSKLQVTLRKN